MRWIGSKIPSSSLEQLLLYKYCSEHRTASGQSYMYRDYREFFPQDILQVFPDCLCFFRKFIFDRKYFRETAIFGMLRVIFPSFTSTQSLNYTQSITERIALKLDQSLLIQYNERYDVTVTTQEIPNQTNRSLKAVRSKKAECIIPC